MSTTLYRKYRPQTWADVAGQNHVKVTLEFELSAGRLAHAYLFSGPRGVGKTTVARILARALNCSDRQGTEPCGACASCQAIASGAALDVIEIDAASHRGIDAVRDNVIEHARFAPARLPRKVFIIDEVHMLTTEAFNALLKTLEEPPKDVVFILATTELHKVPPTIVSRCQRFDFRKIPFTDLVERLHALAEREKCKVDRRTLEEIARGSDGCLRDAEGLLGKVMALGDGKRVTYDEALTVLPRTEQAALVSFMDALLHRDARAALGTVGDLVEGGADLEQFAGESIELLRKTLLAKLAGDSGIFALELDEAQRQRIADWAALADTSTLVRAMETLLEKRQDMKRAHPVQLPLELAAVRICEMDTAAPAVMFSGHGSAQSRQVTAPAAQPQVAAAPKPVVAKNAAPKNVVADELVSQPAPVATGTVATAPESIAAEVARVEERMAALRAGQGVSLPAAEPAPAATGSDSKAGVATVERIRSKWTDFVHRAGEENAGFSYLLGVGEPVSVDGDLVQIGFDFSFHRDKLNEEKNRRLVEKALAAVIGVAVRVQGVLLEKKERMGHDDAALPAMAGARPARQAAGPDALLTAFGGRVVE